jgi:hypothetical protein
VRRDGREDDADTRGRLRALLGVEPVGFLPDQHPDRACLCGCDIAASAAAAGMAVVGLDEWGDEILAVAATRDEGER